MMNFLAHVFLSGNDADLMVGNFIGDFVKGRAAMNEYSAGIIKGIELHRAIDSFTDTHEVVTESKKRLRAKYRHYSGVIVDVYYDHFLAKNWLQFHTTPLPEYAAQTYNTILGFESILPDDVKYMLPYMIKGNWLVNYASPEGIHRALSGMSRRTTFASHMEEATDDLLKDYKGFEDEFMRYFPELQDHCEQKIASLNQARA